MSAREDGQPVSAIFAMRQFRRAEDERAGRTGRGLTASWHRLTAPFAVAWDAAGERLREERLMGLHPERRTVTATALAASPGTEMLAAAVGAHVEITDGERRAAVMVSAEEYDRLLLDRRLLVWERTDLPGVRRSMKGEETP